MQGHARQYSTGYIPLVLSSLGTKQNATYNPTQHAQIPVLGAHGKTKLYRGNSDQNGEDYAVLLLLLLL